MENNLRKGAGALSILWCHLQLPQPVQLPVECQMFMAEMAWVAFRRQGNELGALRKAAATLSTSESENMSLMSMANPSLPRNRMRQSRSYGSVGASGEQSPDSTRTFRFYIHQQRQAKIPAAGATEAPRLCRELSVNKFE